MSLPKKTAFTLDEVISRWKHWGCDYATLQSYAQNDLLVFSVCLRDIGSHKTSRKEDGTEITREVRTLKFVSRDAVHRSLFYLSGDDSRRILEASQNEQVAVDVLYWTTDRIKAQATYYVPPKHFTPKDLVVTQEECERFERRHSANGLRALLKQSAYWIKEPANLKTLKMIGGAIASLIMAIWAVYTWLAK